MNAGHREGTIVSFEGIAINYLFATQKGTAVGGISGNLKRLHPQIDTEIASVSYIVVTLIPATAASLYPHLLLQLNKRAC